MIIGVLVTHKGAAMNVVSLGTHHIYCIVQRSSRTEERGAAVSRGKSIVQVQSLKTEEKHTAHNSHTVLC